MPSSCPLTLTPSFAFPNAQTYGPICRFPNFGLSSAKGWTFVYEPSLVEWVCATNSKNYEHRFLPDVYAFVTGARGLACFASDSARKLPPLVAVGASPRRRHFRIRSPCPRVASPRPRPKPPMTPARALPLPPSGGSGILASQGATNRKHRRICQPPFASPKSVQGFADTCARRRTAAVSPLSRRPPARCSFFTSSQPIT